ncbi:MAG: PIG-L family deacetylase [Paludibacter sp.]|nr:PIG-L family deacetylase [Paludibacter sp.]
MNNKNRKSVAVIVAHPDDETLWAGGTILDHSMNDWFIVCLCRADDKERAERFKNALIKLKAKGIMGNLDDGPDQHPLDEKEVEKEILKLLPKTHFDLILTHDSAGEYTKHLRHEEVNKAVVTLWHDEKITTNELWTFAYEDGNKEYFPKAIESANMFESLSEKTWLKKYKLITQTYGFGESSWEAETTPLAEAFWQFKSPHKAIKSLNQFKDDIKVSKLAIIKLLYNDSFVNELDTICSDTDTNYSTKAMRQSINPFQAIKSMSKKGKELSIFKTSSIEILKLLYYKSKAYLQNKSRFETETNYFEKVSTKIIEPIVKKSLDKLEKELGIFKTPTIETLKTSYYESIGIV